MRFIPLDNGLDGTPESALMGTILNAIYVYLWWVCQCSFTRF